MNVAGDDPGKAAAIVASIQAHRGRWILPFGMDDDLNALIPTLPPPSGTPAHPTDIW